jgi:hypothetical protein
VDIASVRAFRHPELDNIPNVGTFRAAVVFAVLVALCCHAALGAEKVRDWQTGKILDSQRSRYFSGTVGTANNAKAEGGWAGYGIQQNASVRAACQRYVTFLIEGDTYAYLAEEHLQELSSKPANLTVNQPVKFAVEKWKLFVIDDKGKEHEMKIVKKVVRQAAEESK